MLMKLNRFATVGLLLLGSVNYSYAQTFPQFILNDYGQEQSFVTTKENLSTVPNSRLNMAVSTWYTSFLPYSLARRTDQTPRYINPLVFQYFGQSTIESTYESYIFDSIEVGEEGEYIKFRLRNGVLFYKQLDLENESEKIQSFAAKASDVCFSFDVYLKNQKFHGNGALFNANISGCEVLSEREVIIKMNSRGHLSKRLFANFMNAQLIPKSEYSALLDDPSSLDVYKTPVGSGAYFIESYDSQNLTYKKIKDHWFDAYLAERPINIVERFTIKKFLDNNAIVLGLVAGEVDVDFFTERLYVDQITSISNKDFEVLEVPNAHTFIEGVAFNQSRIPSKKVRKALSLVLGTTELYKDIALISRNSKRSTRYYPNSDFTNSPEYMTESMVKTLKGLLGSEDSVSFEDLETTDFMNKSYSELAAGEHQVEQLDRRRRREALNLLNQEGYKIDSKGVLIKSETNEPLEISAIVDSSSRSYIQLAENIAKTLKASLGVKVKVNQIDQANYWLSLRDKDFDFIIDSRHTGGPSVPFAGATNLVLNSKSEWSLVNDPLLDVLTQRLTETGDTDEIRDLVNLIERQIIGEHYFVPLFTSANSYVVFNKANLSGPSYLINNNAPLSGAMYIPVQH